MSIETRLNTDKLKSLIKRAPLKVDAAVRATAFQVEGVAKILSPWMTGANRNSIYTKTSQGVQGEPGSLGDITPDVQIGEAIIAPSMEYSAFLEFGTSKMAARPYLFPAVEQAPKFFEENLSRIFERD